MALMAQIASLSSNKFRDNNTGMHLLKSVPWQWILTQLYIPVHTCMHVNRIWQKIEDLIVIQISSDETYVCPCVTGPSAAVDTWWSICKAPLLQVCLIPRTKSWSWHWWHRLHVCALTSFATTTQACISWNLSHDSESWHSFTYRCTGVCMWIVYGKKEKIW